MQSNKPTSVLIFLGACLAFAEALAGVAGMLDKEMSGIWVLGFGTLNLILVLAALLYMFWSRPEFLIAERRDAVPLRVIEAIVRQWTLAIFGAVIRGVLGSCGESTPTRGQYLDFMFLKTPYFLGIFERQKWLNPTGRKTRNW